MFDRNRFCEDVDNAGGLWAVSLKANIKLQTLSAWYNGTRTPRFISLAGIAAILEFLPSRYVL